jgi:hypothetical protein
VGLSPLYCSHFWPIVPAPDDRWGWLWSNWWNEYWQGKPKYSQKTCPSATLSTTNPTWPDPGSNAGRRGGKPATNRLSYGAACNNTVHTGLFIKRFTFRPTDNDISAAVCSNRWQWVGRLWEFLFQGIILKMFLYPYTGYKLNISWMIGRNLFFNILFLAIIGPYDRNTDCICGLVVRIPSYRSRGSGFDSRFCQICWEAVGLERGALSSRRIT